MKDKFTTKAFSEGYLARSVFKLKYIQKKYKIIKKNYKILDLGASPGSWSQFANEIGAKVTAVDINIINREIKYILYCCIVLLMCGSFSISKINILVD